MTPSKIVGACGAGYIICVLSVGAFAMGGLLGIAAFAPLGLAGLASKAIEVICWECLSAEYLLFTIVCFLITYGSVFVIDQSHLASGAAAGSVAFGILAKAQ